MSKTPQPQHSYNGSVLHKHESKQRNPGLLGRVSLFCQGCVDGLITRGSNSTTDSFYAWLVTDLDENVHCNAAHRSYSFKEAGCFAPCPKCCAQPRLTPAESPSGVISLTFAF